MPIGDSDGVHCTFSSMPADAELCVSDSFPSQVGIKGLLQWVES